MDWYNCSHCGPRNARGSTSEIRYCSIRSRSPLQAVNTSISIPDSCADSVDVAGGSGRKASRFHETSVSGKKHEPNNGDRFEDATNSPAVFAAGVRAYSLPQQIMSRVHHGRVFKDLHRYGLRRLSRASAARNRKAGIRRISIRQTRLPSGGNQINGLFLRKLVELYGLSHGLTERAMINTIGAKITVPKGQSPR